MSGWIKFESDKRHDLRVRKMARELLERMQCDAPTSAVTRYVTDPVTLVLGGLAQLWMHALSFADQDDTMAASLDDIDEISGIKGFGQLLPSDWLEVLGPNRVKLPGFHAHNGTSAKAKASNAERQARYRAKQQGDKSNATSLRVTRHGVTVPLPEENRIEENRREKSPYTPFDPIAVHGLDLEAWKDWVAYRIARKKPIKPFSKPKAAAAMASLGDGQRAAVDHSIANGYQGLVEPKAGTNGRRDAHAETLTHLDLLIAEADAREDPALLAPLGGDVRGTIHEPARQRSLRGLDFGPRHADSDRAQGSGESDSDLGGGPSSDLAGGS